MEELFEEVLRTQRDFQMRAMEAVASTASALVEALRSGHKVLLFGNGGSAADAQHIAAEFVNRFQKDRPPIPALALTTDSSVITSISNDSAFEEIFARQIRALGSRGDVAWGITTSGSSPNVILGLRTAKDLGLTTIGMTGGAGGEVPKWADHWIHVDSFSTPRVQEVHITVAHVICELVEEVLFGGEG